MKRHPTTVEGFDGSLEDLARRVCSMRYDSVAEFFQHCKEELMRQSQADKKRGRTELARRLEHAIYYVRGVESWMRDIFDFCKPHMKDELDADSLPLRGKAARKTPAKHR
jgi:hypothetical protein